ncbi:MAG TPA: hypothetical protein K8W15_12880 [Gallibacterium anatis]|uniref:Uncharacterized protein n=1 Tax=Gallibacterium anatis TaxID=750 RepID=A0A921L2M6_9PAST|nr:hypothetical protein [Gallibacterium anatis]
MNPEKIGYQIGRAVVRFEHWNAPIWLKIIAALGTLILGYWVLSHVPIELFFIITILILAYYLPYLFESSEAYHLRKLREDVASFRDELRRKNIDN